MSDAVVAAIPEGEEVVASIERLAVGSLWVQATGTVESVELSVPRDLGFESISLPGRAALVALAGPAAGPLMATVARFSEGATTITAGRMIRARSAGVQVLVTAAAAARPGAVLAKGSIVAAYPSKPKPAPAAAIGEDESDVMPEYQDHIEHPVFGVCEVMVVKGERMKIRDVNPPHRVRDISLSVFKLLRPEHRDGTKVFKLTKR